MASPLALGSPNELLKQIASIFENTHATQAAPIGSET